MRGSRLARKILDQEAEITVVPAYIDDDGVLHFP